MNFVNERKLRLRKSRNKIVPKTIDEINSIQEDNEPESAKSKQKDNDAQSVESEHIDRLK